MPADGGRNHVSLRIVVVLPAPLGREMRRSGPSPPDEDSKASHGVVCFPPSIERNSRRGYRRAIFMKYSFGCHFPVRAECRSIDPLFLIAVFLVGSYVSWGQGLVDSLSDFFVVRVGQVN